jgi:circadian clock protein KaiC
MQQNIKPYVQNQQIAIKHINPLELFPDEFLGLIRNDAANGFSVLVLDSIRGYKIAMEQFGYMDAHIQNMVNFLKSAGITAFFINELEYISSTSIRLTDLGISYIIDNALLMRFVQNQGRLIRIIGCIKKRLGTFEPEVREYTLDSTGIHVGEKLLNKNIITANDIAS